MYWGVPAHRGATAIGEARSRRGHGPWAHGPWAYGPLLRAIKGAGGPLEDPPAEGPLGGPPAKGPFGAGYCCFNYIGPLIHIIRS